MFLQNKAHYINLRFKIESYAWGVLRPKIHPSGPDSPDNPGAYLPETSISKLFLNVYIDFASNSPGRAVA
jgi:hypothetical protein